MANLTADAPLRILGQVYTEQRNVDSSGAKTIYKGCPVMIDASADTVNVMSAASVTAVDGDVFEGIAAEKHVTAAGDSETDAASLVTLYVQPTIVGFKSTVFTRADVGKTVYMSDTSTLTASNGAYCQIGKLHDVRDGYNYVRLETPKVLDVP